MPRCNTQQFYYASYKKYGTTPQGVQWLCAQTQTQRFEMLLSLLVSPLSTSTLLDVGCGFGDFYTHLQKLHNLPKSYIGVDCLDFMCKEATRNTQQTILHKDATTQELVMSDYVVCSGALNTLTKFESYLFIINCYKHAKVGFVFNALLGDKECKRYNYFCFKELTMLAHTLKVKKLHIKVGYMKNDVTVGFYKQ